MLRPSTVRYALAALLALVALAACAAVNVRSYAHRQFNARSYRTYAWMAAGPVATGDARLDSNRFFTERVRAQVDAQLRERGFTPGSADRSPDLIVHYHASITQKIDVTAADRSSFQSEPEWRPFVFDAGTLVVDLIDGRTNELVWRGWAEGSLQGAIDDQDVMEARIDAAVSRIMARLPPGF